MTKLPVVAIIGRPNVGKSTLFNRLVGKKLALVDDRPGVTRDRREGDASLIGMNFRVIDTAGFEEEDPQTLPGRMRAQTQAAVNAADVALFVVDARAGVVPLDSEIARWLRGADTPIILLANKAEGREAQSGVAEAFRLGFGDPIPFSAEHGEGLVDLFEALQPHLERDQNLPSLQGSAGGEHIVSSETSDDSESSPLTSPAGGKGTQDDERPDAPLKLAIVGRPNAGKSTLVNKMLGEDRMITGPEAGITRDAITIDWQWRSPDAGLRPVRLIDTAGLRKKSKVEDKLEQMSAADTKHAIDFAEVVVLLLDATRGLEAQDLRIADQIFSEGRALVIALNKWDVAENGSSLFQGVRAALEEGFSQVRGVPLLTISAATGKGIDQLLQAAFETRAAWSQRLSTGQMNRWFEKAIDVNPPPAPGGRRIKLRYITQIKTRPPSFVIFGTRVDQLPESYRRYLVNGIRRELGFGAVPVRLTLRNAKNPYDSQS